MFNARDDEVYSEDNKFKSAISMDGNQLVQLEGI